MMCVVCKHGETRPGVTTVVLHRAGSVSVIKDVPADICENCGEYYLSAVVAGRVLARANEAARTGAEVDISRFAA